MFGKTKMCHGVIMQDNKEVGGSEYDEMLWVERGEDWYALMSPGLRGKRILVVERQDWLRGKATP